MTSATAPVIEEPLADETSLPRTRSYYAREAAGVRRRISELKKYGLDQFGPVMRKTAESQRFLTSLLHHFAHYAEGERLAENFLATRTRLNQAERAAAIQAAFRSKRLYTADELAASLGVDMAKRTALGLTTIGAVDCDRDARAKLQNEKRNAARREKRERDKAAMAVPPPSKRKSDRRTAAIYAALPPEGRMTVAELCSALKGARPFSGLGEASIRKVVHRLIKADCRRLFEMTKGKVKGQMFEVAYVARNYAAPIAPRRPAEATSEPGKRFQSPTDEGSYQAHFERTLASFTVGTALDIARWFYGTPEKELRDRCGVSHREDEFMVIARARRNELIGRPASRHPEPSRDNQ